MIGPRGRQALALVAATILGAVAGVAGERLRLARSEVNPMDAATMLSQMDRRLGLDSTQHATMARILARHQAAIDAAWRTVRPAVQGAVDSTQMEIISVLRPDQRDRYVQWVRVAHRGVAFK
jgi:hypothetical protein